MSYCVNCGVELEKGAKKCPLCGTEVINPREAEGEHIHSYPVYSPTPKQHIKKSTVVSLITLILLLPDFLTTLCDYTINGTITWSSYVMGALLCLYLIIVFPILLSKHGVTCVVLMAADILGFLLFIELKTNGKWFLTFALPTVTVLAVFIAVISLLKKEKKISSLTAASVSVIFLGLFCVLIEFLINTTFGVRGRFAWSFYPAVTFILLAVAMFLIGKNKALCEKLEKKFFL